MAWLLLGPRTFLNRRRASVLTPPEHSFPHQSQVVCMNLGDSEISLSFK